MNCQEPSMTGTLDENSDRDHARYEQSTSMINVGLR